MQTPSLASDRLARALIAAAAALALSAAGAAAAPARHLDKSGKVQRGVASYYGLHHAGKTTASGARMKPHRMTAASRTLPLGTKAKVVNPDTGKSVTVTVNDRGPYVKDRILDLSTGAAKKLGMKQDGVAEVTVKPIALPPG